MKRLISYLMAVVLIASCVVVREPWRVEGAVHQVGDIDAYVEYNERDTVLPEVSGAENSYGGCIYKDVKSSTFCLDFNSLGDIFHCCSYSCGSMASWC